MASTVCRMTNQVEEAIKFSEGRAFWTCKEISVKIG